MRSLRTWLEFCRLPEALAVMADPLAGALIVGARWRDAPGVVLVMAASACVYAGGAVLNDWHDFKADLAARPDRALPAGRIRRLHALLLAIVLLAGGPVAVGMAGCEAASQAAWLLVAAVVLYDILLKDVPFAPLVAGLCRSLNLLMGMALVPAVESPIGWPMRTYLAGVLGVYVVGVTVFARDIERPGRRRRLAAGAATWSAVLALAALSFLFPEQAPHRGALIGVAVLIAVIGYRMSSAILNSQAGDVQSAARTANFGAVLLDAAAVAFARGLLAGAAVLILLTPAIWVDAKLRGPPKLASPPARPTATPSAEHV